MARAADVSPVGETARRGREISGRRREILVITKQGRFGRISKAHYYQNMQELQAIVSGRVQGVMMRDFVQRSARKIGASGYVKNLEDGTVEVVAQGERVVLEKLIERLHKGSLFSRVDAVRVDWRAPATAYKGFVIDYGA